MKYSKQKGVMLLEAIITLGILLPLFLIIVSSVVQSSNNALSMRSLHERLQSNEKISSILERVLDGLDSNRLGIPLRIHINGNTTYVDGTPFTLSRTFPPAPTSDVLSYAILDFEQTLLVHDFLNASLIYACPYFASRFEDKEYRGFIALTPEGAYETPASYTRHIGNSKCLDIALHTSKSVMTPALESGHVRGTRLLVPIDEIGTLYVDTHEQLRYVSHSGESIIENQPIFRNISSINFSSALHESGATILKSTWKHSHQSTYAFENINHLTTLPYEAILLL